MSRKTNRYKHFGVEFSSSKPSVMNLESFTEKAQRPRSDYLFWLLTCNGEYRLFDKDSMVEHFTHILDEIDSIKSRGPKNGKFVEDTCKEVLAFFKKDYNEEQYAKRKEIYEKENLEKDYGCIEKFIDNLPNIFKRWKGNYDFSNGSYYRPYLAEKNVLRQDENLKKNFEINMKHFASLDKNEFNESIQNFLKRYPEFEEIKNLDQRYLNNPGYYVLILDNYKQVYIGQATNIKKRIMQHWSINKTRNRRIFGSVEKSKISIDSFGPFDTTRILVCIDQYDSVNSFHSHEDEFINFFNNKFVTNRVCGGELPFGILVGNNKDISE